MVSMYIVICCVFSYWYFTMKHVGMGSEKCYKSEFVLGVK